VAVEAALVTPLVMALIFGIIECSVLFKDVLAASAAVRAGVRLASAEPRNSDFAQAAADQVSARTDGLDRNAIEALWVYKAATGSDKPVGYSDFSGCTSCVKFTWNAGTNSFVPTYDGWPAASQNACTPSLGGPPDHIGVYLRVRHTPLTGLVLGTLSIPESSVLSLEPIPAGAGCKP
jgi:TadE-like protein